jgi:uncharacterized membrane protein
MTEKSHTQALIQKLHDAHLISGESDDIYAQLQETTPWFARILQAVSGWLASLFLLMAFGALFGGFFKEETALFVIGAFLIAGAWGILRQTETAIFVEHIALALSLAGQAMITIALSGWLNDISISSIFWVALALLEVTLLIMIPNHLHRIFSAFVFVVALFQGLFLLGLGGLAVPLMLLGIAWLWLHEYDFGMRILMMQAIGEGATLGLFALSVIGYATHYFWGETHHIHGLNHPSIIALANGLVMLYIAWTLMRTEPMRTTHRIAILVFVAVLALLSTKMVGLSVMVTLLVVGFARGNTPLQGLSIAGLLWSVGHYYYSLETTLLIKSALLGATGIVLLLAYALMRSALGIDKSPQGDVQ